MLKHNFLLRCGITLLSALVIAPPSQAKINNFTQAKAAAVTIHQGVASFYCGCQIQWQGKKGQVNHASCGYQVRRDPGRAARIEWEHVMPAAHFGSQMPCWRAGGRANCANNKQYVNIETDLHNLQPAIGEVNQNRSHFQFSPWRGGEGQYGRCEMKVDFKNKQADPPDRARGAIARTYLYMRDKYHVSLSKSQTQLMRAWDIMYPVSAWECERDKRIASVQGNHNPYVLNACQTTAQRSQP